MTNAVNYALYQVGWLACIFGAAWSHPWIGAAAGSVTLAAHVLLSERRLDEWRLACIVGVLGVVVESAQIAAGTLRFTQGVVVAWLPPVWLVLLWMQFAGTLRYSLRWVTERTSAAVLFGAIGGPLAYVAVARLDIVQFHAEMWRSLLTLSFLWGLAVPAAARAARASDGAAPGRYRFVASL